jgi:proteic killer suppression protein
MGHGLLVIELSRDRKGFQTGAFRKDSSGHSKGGAPKTSHASRSSVREDLNFTPGNRLEALKGIRRGQHSVRINDQYRIRFIWAEGKARDVEIVDYHKG